MMHGQTQIKFIYCIGLLNECLVLFYSLEWFKVWLEQLKVFLFNLRSGCTCSLFLCLYSKATSAEIPLSYKHVL